MAAEAELITRSSCSGASSGAGADTGRISEAMPPAFLGLFGLSLCPRPAESVLPFRRYRTPGQGPGQEQRNHRLTRHGSHGWLVAGLLDHLIRPLQERRRDREAEGLGGLEVDHQLELGRLLDGEVAGLRAL